MLKVKSWTGMIALEFDVSADTYSSNVQEVG